MKKMPTRFANSRPVRRGVTVFAICAALGLSGLASTAAADSAAAADDNGGIGISITVPSPTSSSTPSPSPSASTGTLPSTSSGAGRGGAATVSTTTAETAPTDPASTELDANTASLGGVVLLSGLTTTYDPSLNPLDGSVIARFTVRNISNESIDSKAKFWLTSPVGNTLSTEVENVGGLDAGESRVVSARLSGVGQWTVVTAHMTFTPPAEVGGVKLVPVSRDLMVFAEPWLVFTGLLVAAGAYAVAAVLRMARMPRAPRVTA